MNVEAVIQQARGLCAQWTKDAQTPEPNRLDLSLAEADLVPAVSALRTARWGYLSAITGLDRGGGELEALYHFCSGAAVLTLRVRIQRAEPSIPTLCGVLPAASFFERELSEMFGVTIVGAQNPEHLFLPDDWSAGEFPLRKDFRTASG